MPVNRNALIRYRTIDNCLRNRFRKWTLDDLIEACSEALYEYEGIDKGVSRRTVQMDLQMMRSDKLGYNAPIEVLDKKYYIYADPEYTITNIPLTDQDLSKLTEVVDILRQFKGFAHFRELNGMVQRLEDRIHTAKTKLPSVIDLEKNEGLKGLEFLDVMYQDILKKRAVAITYKSFKARESQTFNFHPYLLKEYRNRWFVLGRKKRNQPILTLALDRVEKVEPATVDFVENDRTDLTEYYKHVVGVTVSEDMPPEEVVLFIDRENAPYVLTKPIHHSQEVLEAGNNGIVIRLYVQHNFELEREILGFGDRIKVLQPAKLRNRIKVILGDAVAQYDREMSLKELSLSKKRVARLGFSVLENVYSQKEVRRMRSMIHRVLKHKYKSPENVAVVPDLLQTVPAIAEALFTPNLKKVLKVILGDHYFLVKAVCYLKHDDDNSENAWKQQTRINVLARQETEGFAEWEEAGSRVSVCPPGEVLHDMLTVRIHLNDAATQSGAMRLIPKTHYGIMSEEDITEKLRSSDSFRVEVESGGVHLMRPLILYSEGNYSHNVKARQIHLEFATCELPGSLEWAERNDIFKQNI